MLGDSCYVLMISHRGISVITPLPLGEGTGEGPAGDGGGASISRNTNHVNRKCQDISQAVPFSFREKAEYATRRGFSTFENMPFLRQEGRLLRARRAYTRMQNVTH